MENFPWNRVAPAPSGQKPMADLDKLRRLAPAAVRDLIGDGNYGGEYEKPDEQMLRIWQVAVEETRDLINGL
jgi:creatinine amidohydrolase